jgi:hypothetical protein
LTDLKALKKAKPELESLMNFQIIRSRINNEGEFPSACISFTQPLAAQGITYSDYISIAPKVDGSISPNCS